VTVQQREQALSRIAEHGVVGAGGAGFPTHVKLRQPVGTVILNAAECEPLMHKDKELLRHHGELVVRGLVQAAAITGAHKVVAGVKGKYEDVIAGLQRLLPGDGVVVPLGDTYPSGDEFVLVYDVTGRVIPPGGLPRDVDCVVINVETAYNLGKDEPVTDTFLTVAGAVARPCTVRVPVGVPFSLVLELAGGATVSSPRLLSGGAMMGQFVGPEDPISKACGGVLVLPGDHPLVRRREQSWQQIARIGASACDQCSFCTELCPRYLLGHPIEPHLAMRTLGFVEDRAAAVRGAQFCCECNLCTLVACPEDLDPKRITVHHKQALRAQGQRWQAQPHPYRADVTFADRRVPMRRLIQKLGLGHFTNEGPLLEQSALPAQVTLPLLQHTGAPARPVVASGARVRRGDVVARPAPGALGASVHASIDGRCELFEDRIVVRGAARGGS